MPGGWRRRDFRGAISSGRPRALQPSFPHHAIANYSQQAIVPLLGWGVGVMTVETMEGGLGETGWNRPRGTPSLSEVFGSIRTKPSGSFARKLAAFLGPGYLVAVGYMDPGNWATSLAGRSEERRVGKECRATCATSH